MSFVDQNTEMFHIYVHMLQIYEVPTPTTDTIRVV